MRIFIFLLFTFFVNADYLNTKTTNQCVYDVTPYQNNKGLCYIKRSNNQSFCSTTLRYTHLIDGYEFVNGICVLKNDLKITGLTENQLNYQMYLMGNLMGFSILIMSLFLSILSSRK